MGKLIVVVGTTGVGKTALVRTLCKQGPFASGLEDHQERPFQRIFKTDVRYAFANQLDYMMLGAEQERKLRETSQIGLMDGGLEMDFHGFTRLFLARFWLSQAEFELCKRFYELVRVHQPPPDLIIHLTASPQVITHRLATRKRINIAGTEDILQLDLFLQDWLSSVPSDHLIHIDVSENDLGYQRLTPSLLKTLQPFYK